jgi:hypothetical protein
MRKYNRSRETETMLMPHSYRIECPTSPECAFHDSEPLRKPEQMAFKEISDAIVHLTGAIDALEKLDISQYGDDLRILKVIRDRLSEVFTRDHMG